MRGAWLVTLAKLVEVSASDGRLLLREMFVRAEIVNPSEDAEVRVGLYLSGLEVIPFG